MPRSEVALRTLAPPPLAPPSTRRILFVCLVFHPDSSASSLLFTDLFRRLASQGAEITVLCGFPSKDGDREPVSLRRQETLDGIEIIRCGLRLQGKRNLPARALAYGSFLAHAGWKLLRLGRDARMVGGTDPPFTSIALWLLSWIGRFDYECILLDVYPDGLVGVGALKDRAPLTRLWRALNRLSYRRARQLTVIGRDMIALLQRYYGVDPHMVRYIPHWSTREVDSVVDRTSVSGQPEGIRDSIRPADQGQGTEPCRGGLREQLHFEDKFVVQYSGNMGLWHDIESLVRAADSLRHDERIHFLFIGKGMRRRAAEGLSRELGLSNVTWLEFLPREQLAEGLASCDLALISLRAGLEGVAVPSKLYGILASGRPVIAQVPRESEVAYVIEEEQCGLVVEPGDVEGLARAIQALASDPSVARRMGARALAAYREKYTIEQAASAFTGIWQLA